MSFILDALKKSELDRQRQAAPGLVEAGIARPRRRLPVWALALAGLLAVNLIVLVVVLMRGSGHAEPVAAQRTAAGRQTAGETADAAAPAGQAAPFSPLDSSPVYAPEIPVGPAHRSAEGPAQAAIAKPPAAAPRDSWAPPRVERHRDPVLSDADSKAESEVLPTVSELNPAGPEALPQLHLDMHVYSTNAADRFVFINMRKYHEGATLEEGPTVERIRRDGVVLDYQGMRFLLPRQ